MAELDVNKLYTRLDKLLNSYVKNRSSGLWNNAHCLSIHRGDTNEEDPYEKSMILHQYLFGYELPDTIFVLMPSGHCYLLATKKKCDFLSVAVGKQPSGSSIQLTCLVKGKEDNPVDLYNKLMKEIRNKHPSPGGDAKIRVGVLQKEWESNTAQKKGASLTTLVSGWQNTLSSMEHVDVTLGISILMAVKDEVELDLLKKSSVLSNKLMKHGFVARLEQIIEQEEKITHDALSMEIETMIEDPSKINLKIPPDQVQSCYYPIVQSGGEYDLRISAQPTQSTLKYDVITVSFGSRYQLYCSNIARTFLVDPPTKVKDAYEILMAVQDACIVEMVPGNPLKNVYLAAVKKLQSLGHDDWVEKLPKNLGFAVGIDFRESALLLTSKNTALFRSGMVFNLSIGFSDIELRNNDRSLVHEKSAVKNLQTFSLLIADTIFVSESTPEILTKHGKTLENITYLINTEEEEDNEEDSSVEVQQVKASKAPKGDEALARKLAKNDSAANRSGGQRSSARLAATNTSAHDDTVAQREKRQIELMNRRNEERVRELARAAKRGGDKDESVKAEELETYRSSKEYPDNVLPNQVKVDMVNKCVILPIGGNPIPFHISTIKNVVLPDPDTATYLRINFYSAGVPVGKDAPKNTAKLIEKYAPYTSFIREMTFRSMDSHNLTDAFRKISELRKRERTKEVQEQEEADLVQQEKLIRTKNERVPRLSDLTMRPVFAGRKTQGNLEAHTNGLRFISNRGEVVDIIYSNIKHAIFQDCKQEIMVLIHFHLKNPIMVGKKKHNNIQFFTEVVDASQAVDGSRRSMYDPDELDDEQRERQLRKKLNDAFKDFSMKVESVAKKNGHSIEFDIPYRDLGFQGTPNKEMVYIMPTLNCLVNLTETPFFVVDLSELDHVHFERVTFASKAFDMVLIFKDFTKTPDRIDMIPNEEKDSIQEWLTDMEITYTEGPMNLMWKNIMESVRSDDRFYMDTEEDEITEKPAGWSGLRLYGANDESEEDSIADDSEFDEEEEEGESEEEEDESEFDDDEEEEESDYDADEDLEEQGMDWDEMEKKALNEDRKKGRMGREEDEEDKRRDSRTNKRTRR